MTNADKIRQMTDEELAEILELSDCMNCPAWDKNCGARICRKAFLEWLKEDVPENGKTD